MRNLILTIAALFVVQLATAQMSVGLGANTYQFEDTVGKGFNAQFEYNHFVVGGMVAQDDTPSLGGEAWTSRMLGLRLGYDFAVKGLNVTLLTGIDSIERMDAKEIDGRASENVDFNSVSKKNNKFAVGLQVRYSIFYLGFEPISMSASAGIKINIGSKWSKSGANKYKGTRW